MISEDAGVDAKRDEPKDDGVKSPEAFESSDSEDDQVIEEEKADQVGSIVPGV